MKRQDYISFDEMYMGIAAVASYRSKDPSTQNGFVIVNPENKIVSIGYNGFPEDCDDDVFPWTSPEKYPYAEHSERNAIYNTNVDLKGCVGYLFSERGYYPCSDCARAIVRKGIKKIYMACAIKEEKSVSGTYTWDATLRMFEAAKVELIILEGAAESFVNIANKLKVSSDIINKIEGATNA